MLGLVSVLTLAMPVVGPSPAHASDATTVTTDGGVLRLVFEVVRKVFLELYVIIDRLMDGARDGGGGCCCGASGCACGGGSGGGGTGGGGTGGGGSGGGGTTPPGGSPPTTP
jgi:hypothetical protein